MLQKTAAMPQCVQAYVMCGRLLLGLWLVVRSHAIHLVIVPLKPTDINHVNWHLENIWITVDIFGNAWQPLLHRSQPPSETPEKFPVVRHNLG